MAKNKPALVRAGTCHHKGMQFVEGGSPEFIELLNTSSVLESYTRERGVRANTPNIPYGFRVEEKRNIRDQTKYDDTSVVLLFQTSAERESFKKRLVDSEGKALSRLTKESTTYAGDGLLLIIPFEVQERVDPNKFIEQQLQQLKACSRTVTSLGEGLKRNTYDNVLSHLQELAKPEDRVMIQGTIQNRSAILKANSAPTLEREASLMQQGDKTDPPSKAKSAPHLNARPPQEKGHGSSGASTTSVTHLVGLSDLVSEHAPLTPRGPKSPERTPELPSLSSASTDLGYEADGRPDSQLLLPALPDGGGMPAFSSPPATSIRQIGFREILSSDAEIRPVDLDGASLTHAEKIFEQRQPRCSGWLSCGY